MFNSEKRFAKRHYNNKIQIIRKKILDVGFLVDEYKMTREGFRTEYDRIKEMQDACVVRIEGENKKEDKDKDVIAQLTKLKEKYDPDILKLQKQMETIDLQIDGPLPNGQQCLKETLDGLRTVIELLKRKIAKL